MTRPRLPAILAAALAAPLALALPRAGHAQSTTPDQGAPAAPPARNGNVWDGRAHPPSPASVRAGEQASGIAAPEPRERQQDNEVEQLNDELQLRARRDVERPPTPAP